MGMYTELVLGVDLKEETPYEIVRLIRLMVEDDSEKETYDIPNHELFETSRWRHMLHSGSHYFPGITTTKLVSYPYSEHKSLSIRCNFKNYDSEIEHFLDWIAPYVEDYGFAGYMRYETDNEPQLIYFENNNYRLRTIHTE